MRAFRATEDVKCGDKTYTLAIDIEIIDALEDEFDLGFDKIFAETIGKLRIGKTTRLLRGLLSRHHPDIELDDVGALAMEFGSEFGDAIGRLIDKASPDTDETKGENPPKAHRGTGGNSSSRGARQGSSRQSSGAKRHALSS
jgi:hypothetical protein